MRGICRGLEYLHSRKVIHADLKSVRICDFQPFFSNNLLTQENILISDAGTPLLADFGLSLILAQTTSTTFTQTSVLQGGTTRWMAPELFDPTPQRHDEFTDIWAYGMVTYVRGSAVLDIDALEQYRFIRN